MPFISHISKDCNTKNETTMIGPNLKMRYGKSIIFNPNAILYGYYDLYIAMIKKTMKSFIEKSGGFLLYSGERPQGVRRNINPLTVIHPNMDVNNIPTNSLRSFSGI